MASPSAGPPPPGPGAMGWSPPALPAAPFPRASPPPSAMPLAATLLQAAVFVRHLGMLTLVLLWWTVLPFEPWTRNFPLSPVDDPWVLALMPLAGLAASTAAMYCDLTRRYFAIGTAACVASLAASATPGLFLGVGAVGLVTGGAALAMHLASFRDFAAVEAHLAGPSPASP